MTESQNDIRVLVIDKGFSKDGRIKHIQQLFSVEMISVPEPTDDLQNGSEILKHKIETWKPHVLIASSRGGKYAAELISSGSWKGATVLISAMSTSMCITPGVPLVLAHGANDSTNPITRVREDVELGTKGLVDLREFEDDHHLGVLLADASILPSLINRALKMEQQSHTVAANPTAVSKPKPAAMRNALMAQLMAKK